MESDLNPTDIEELRAFLAGLVADGRGPRRVPPSLYRLAARFVRHGEQAEDLVQDLVVDLANRRAQAGGIPELLRLGDGDLLAALRQRLVQVAAASRGGRWALVKTVRAHVRQALSAPLPPVVAAPVSVTAGDRVQGALVAAAVAWHGAQPGQGTRDAKGLAAWIVAEYFPAPTAADLLGAETDAGTDYQQVEAALDAPGVAGELRALLGPAQARVVARRAAGASLKDIAATEGCALSSARARTRLAVERVADHAKTAGWSTESLRLALGLLEAA